MNDHDFHARMAVLEHRVNNLDMKITALESKIDQLLELRSKGVGVFWLASLLFGTGLFGAFMTFVKVLKG